MLDPTLIPSEFCVPAKDLVALGMPYSELKSASQHGGILKRWKSPKTKRVYYKSKNLFLFDLEEFSR